MANFLTNLLFEPKGKHDPNKTYTIKDTVMSADASKVYFALQDVPAGISLDNTDYWILQMDLSASKNAMETAAANARTQTDTTIASANTRVEDMMGKAANAVTSVADYASKVGMRVKGETKITKGNPMTIYPDGGSLLKVQTDIPINQSGSDDPYPAGRGRNKLVPNVNYGIKNGIEFIRNADGSWTVKGTSTAGNAFFNLNYVNNTTSLITPGEYILNGSATGVKLQVMVNGEYSVESVGGEDARFTISETTPNCWVRLQVPNAGMTVDTTVYPMVRLATDDDKSYAPPSNIRPITGYNALKLNRMGKNLCPPIIESPNTYNQVTWTPKYDVRGNLLGYETSGTASGSTNITHLNFFDLPAGTYIVSGAPSGSVRGNGDIVVQNEAYDAIARAHDGSTIDTFTLTAPSKVRVVCQLSSGTVADGKMFKPMIRLASDTDDSYEPYQGNAYTVQLGQTVCGGRFDWLTGKLVAEWGFVELGGNTQFDSANTMLYPNGERIRLTYNLPSPGRDSAYELQLLCNQIVNGYSIGGWNQGPVDNVWILSGYPSTLVMALPVSVFGTTEASVKAKLAETPLQVAYKLKTPIERQLAPNVITATEDGGVNHIYGDADLTAEWVNPLETSLTEHSNAKVDASNKALLSDIAQKECSVGNPIVINDAVSNVAFPHVETVFAPKQTGSGDPYPAGGGKNKLCLTALGSPLVTNVTVNALDANAIKLTSTAANVFQQWRGVIRNVEHWRGKTFTLSVGEFERNYSGGEPFVYAIETPVPYEEATEDQKIYSSIWSFPGNVTFTIAQTTKDLAILFRLDRSKVTPSGKYARWGKIQLEEGSAVTAFESGENIRPITGYDTLNLNHAGKNLAPIYANETKGGMTLTAYDDGSVSLTGTYTAGDAFSFRGEYETSLPPGTYTISVNNPEAITASGFWIAPYDDTITIIKSILMSEANTVYTLTTDKPIKQIRIRGARDVALDNFVIKLQVEKGSTATGFVKPQSDFYTVQIGQTVYGGRMDWLTGKLTAEYGFITLTGNEAYTFSGGKDLLLALQDAPEPIPGGVEAWCSHYKRTLSATASGILNCEFTVSHKSISGIPRLCIRDSVHFTDLSSGQAYIAAQHAAGTPVQIVYKLATPVEIKLDPTRITTIPGINTIFGDGEFTIDWFKSYKKVAEERENLLLDSFTDKIELSGNPIEMNPVGGLMFDGVVTEFSPKQAGSGDPYPSGGGRNLLPTTASTTTMQGLTHTVNSDGTIGVKGTSETENASFKIGEVILPAGEYIVSGAAGDSQLWVYGNDTRIQTNDSRFSLTEATLVRCNLYVRKGVTYDVVISPMIRRTSDTDSTYAPPANIRPITGWDKLSLIVSGKNLAPTHKILASNAGLTYAVSDGKITITGTATKNVRLDTDNIILPPGQYTLAPNNSVPAPIALYMRKPNGTQFGSINMEKSTTAKHTFTLSEPTEACVSMYISSGAVLDVTVAVMLNVGTVKAFEPYHGNIYTVQIGQTVYGGKFDWNTSKLIADRALSTLNGTEAWTASSTNTTGKYRYFANNLVPGILAPPNTSTIAEGLVCSHYKAAPSTTNGTYQCVQSCGIYTSGTLYFYDDRYADKTADDWKAYVAAQYAAGTPIQVAYTLAKPIEIHLPATDINTLSGTNTLYGDGDTITVKFRQSKTISLEERLSALEAAFLNQ